MSGKGVPRHFPPLPESSRCLALLPDGLRCQRRLRRGVCTTHGVRRAAS